MNGTRISPAEAGSYPLLWDGDVVVVGGGSAGSAAAVAAARRGASTLLVESAAHLGGTGASVLDTFYGFYAPGTGERVVGGVGWEVCEALTDRKAAFERPNTYGAGTGITYDPETLKLVWDELTGAAGVRVLFHARASRVVMEDQNVVGVVVETVSQAPRTYAPGSWSTPVVTPTSRGVRGRRWNGRPRTASCNRSPRPSVSPVSTPRRHPRRSCTA